MAKEIAIGKRAKISEAQQNMLMAVIVASALLGVAIAFTVHFIQQISFNAKVIMASDESIVAYSNAIKSIGVCKSPRSEVYSDEELKKCDPDSIEASEIPNTLRANILEKVAANEALNSVPNKGDSNCINPETSKSYTYKELNEIYKNANGSSELNAASQLIKSCSALRVIPDALPAFKNEEALLASLNKLFIESNWEPESISPSGTTSNTTNSTGAKIITLRLPFSADTGTTKTILNNIERSIREFDITKATISWEKDNQLSISAQANAYYVDETTITETTKTIKAEGK